MQTDHDLLHCNYMPKTYEDPATLFTSFVIWKTLTEWMWQACHRITANSVEENAISNM
jgi:hypothetical protein